MIDLTVKTLDSQNHVFSLEDDQITVRGFKEYIAESVAVPADSQRLIYCGRVLQDEKKLNDYDVNGKVLHLVQRAPPQHGQRGNDSGQQAQGQNNRQQQRSHYRLTRAQMHGNAMYLGAMSVPAEFVEGHGIPQLSNSLSGSRLSHAGRMLDRINELIDRLDDPNAPLHPTPSELSDYQQPPMQQHQQLITQETDAEQDENADVARADGSARIAEAAAAAITAALSAAGARAVTLFRGGNYNGTEGRTATSDAADNQNDTPSQPQQPQQQQQQQQQQQAQAATEQSGATSSNAGQNRRAQQQDLPRPPQMAELLQRLYNTQDRLRPYLERYCVLTLVDPSLSPGPGPNTVEDSQRIVDGVSEILHYMSHTCHALSDIIIDMSQPPPRNLRCRPIIVQHSAILQPGIPIQVEAHISLNGRGVNNNNSNDETAEAGNQQAQADNNSESSNASRVHTEEGGQERESDATTQSQTERPQQEQGQSPFVFNLPNNVEVLMEVSSESNIDDGANNEQNAAGEGNNGGNTRRTGVFPFGPAPPPYFMRNFMQAVAGHMVHGGFGATTISTSQNPPATTASNSAPASMDSGNANSGQSTQARSNVGTHPTTATQTRSTSRPHVFHHHTHPVGLGMSIGLGLDFDPYLPCNSHHVYRTPTSTPSTNANGGVTTSQTTRTTPTTAASTADASSNQAQTATTSTSTSASATSTTGTSTTNAGLGNSNLLGSLLQQMMNASGRSQPNISINSNVPEGLGNILQMLGGRNIHVGYVSDRNSINDFILADLFESVGLNMHISASPASTRGENFLFDLFVLGAQNITVDGVFRLSCGEWEPISRLRRPLRDFLWHVFPNATSRNVIQEQVAENLLSHLQPYLREFLASEEDASGRSDSRIDVYATIETLIARSIRDILRILFDTTHDDRWFAQDTLEIVKNLGKQFCAVLRYSIQGGQAGLEAIVSRFLSDRLEGAPPSLRQWILNGFIEHFRTYSLRAPQPSDSEIVSLLVYKDSPSQQSSVQSSASARQPAQAPLEDEPMETETLEQRPTRESSTVPEDREEVPETFTGHEALPSDWVPIIARDGVRQRRQLQMQGVTNSGVTTFSDAYLGGLPTKRRKLIEQQKPRLLVSPTPNHSTIAASMERLVREGVGHAGVEEVEGAAVAVAADPAVRRAFGQAIRDCLNPCRYGTPDFPDPLRFPNATKYFADQERPPK